MSFALRLLAHPPCLQGFITINMAYIGTTIVMHHVLQPGFQSSVTLWIQGRFAVAQKAGGGASLTEPAAGRGLGWAFSQLFCVSSRSLYNLFLSSSLDSSLVGEPQPCHALSWDLDQVLLLCLSQELSLWCSFDSVSVVNNRFELHRRSAANTGFCSKQNAT